jgi:hypothetical protein
LRIDDGLGERKLVRSPALTWVLVGCSLVVASQKHESVPVIEICLKVGELVWRIPLLLLVSGEPKSGAWRREAVLDWLAIDCLQVWRARLRTKNRPYLLELGACVHRPKSNTRGEKRICNYAPLIRLTGKPDCCMSQEARCAACRSALLLERTTGMLATQIRSHVSLSPSSDRQEDGMGWHFWLGSRRRDLARSWV